MSEQNVYQQIGRLITKKINNQENLQELRQVKMQKVAECENKTIEAMRDYLSVSGPVMNTMHEDDNQLLTLENTAISSMTPFTDSFRDLRIYLDGKFTDMDRKFERKFTDMDRKFTDMDRKFERKFTAMDRNFANLNLQLAQLKNITLNKEGEDATAVPFLDGTWPEAHGLPEIRKVSDIDALSRDQCRQFLTGYGISFGQNETLNLKIKLRDVIGFSLGKELKHPLHTFGTE